MLSSLKVLVADCDKLFTKLFSSKLQQVLEHKVFEGFLLLVFIFRITFEDLLYIGRYFNVEFDFTLLGVPFVNKEVWAHSQNLLEM